jgi:hypothetical protein
MRVRTLKGVQHTCEGGIRAAVLLLVQLLMLMLLPVAAS